MAHTGRRQPGLKQQQLQEQRTPSPLLSLLPTDLLGQVIERIPAATSWPCDSEEEPETHPSRLSARTTCRWLRDAFDSCNTHLVLLGAAAADSEDSAQRRSYHALLQRLIARTSSLSSLRIRDWENSRELLKLPVPWGQLKNLDLSALTCYHLYTAPGKLKHRAFGPLAHCSGLEELVIFCDSLFMSKPYTLPFRSTLRSLCLLDPSNRDLGSIAPLFTALQRLELKTPRGLGSQNDKLGLANVTACTGLRQLCFQPCVFADFNGNMSSLTSLTQLTSLRLRECSALEDLQPIALLSSLRHLELEEAYKITDISPLGSLRSSLERLVITDGYFVGSEACLSSCTLLRHLALRNFDADNGDFDLSALSACTLLEHLDLSNSPVTGSLEPLSPCTRLQRLLLTGCWLVTALTPLSSLVELELSYCNIPVDLSPLMACASLTRLDITQCNQVSSLTPLAACKKLQVLRLGACFLVTSLEPIAACSQLVCLDLSGCSGIRSLAPLSALRAMELLLLGQCNSLASLEPLGACKMLKRLGLKLLAIPIDLAPLAACLSLQQLDLVGCCSNMELAPLQSCSRLEKLHLTAGSPLYHKAVRSLSHLKDLAIMET